MSKTGKNLLMIGLGVVFLFTAVLACRPTPAAEAVTVAINDPPDGSTVVVGQEVMVDSTVTAAAGVARVDLSVDGQIVRYDVPPSGNPTTFQVSQSWMPTSEGQVAISVTGYDVEAAMDQVTVTLQAVVLNVVINSPPDNSAVVVGQEVLIDSTTFASSGVTQVELYVDDVVVRRDVPPSGEPTTFRVAQPWMPMKEGQAVISVVAYVNEASSKATITLQVLESGGVVPTAPPTAEPTETPPPPVTTEAGCTLDSQYVADVTIPDGTVMSPGAGFVKTWKVKNSGTCDWDAGFQLVFVGGAQMGGPASVLLPAVPAGGQTDISVNLTAPTAYGTHKGMWRVRSDKGTVFGTNLTVLIVVASPATEAPVTDTPLPTDVPTVGPLPNLETYAFFTDPSTIVAGVDFDVTVTVANFTAVPVADFTIHVLLMDPGESCLEGGSGTLLLDRQASIAAQQFATVGTTARIDTAGQHTLCLRIDPSDTVEELYEDDNDMQLTFTVSASPEADSKIHGHTFHDCSGQTHATFLIENTGGLLFEWARLRLEDLDDTLAVFPESDQPFKSSPTGCGFASEGETLGVGATGYIGRSIDFMTSGNSARATITLCTDEFSGCRGFTPHAELSASTRRRPWSPSPGA